MSSEERGVRGESRRAVSSRLALRARFLPPRSALTLIELLVVIIILTTLVSAAIPLLSPTNDDRRLREASRGVNSFISAAQMKAIQLQRPFGVAIKRLSQDTNPNLGTQPIHDDNAVSIELYYVEQPAPFVGFDTTSAAQIALDNGPTGGAGQLQVRFVRRGNVDPRSTDKLPEGWDRDSIPPYTIRPGDVIEIQGSQFRITDTDSDPTTGFYTSTSGTPDGTLVMVPVNDTGQQINVEFDNLGRRMRDLPSGTVPTLERPYWTYPTPYKILRQPTPTSAEPFQMPDGTAIDLRASGVGQDDYFYVKDVHDNAEGILIMFAPEGRVSRVVFSQMPNDPKPFDETVTDNLFLLIGRRAIAPPPPVSSDKSLSTASGNLPAVGAPGAEQTLQDIKSSVNWLRSESRWIAIGSQSGRVVTVDNASVDPRTVILENGSVPQSSEELRNEQIRAAREFAREMTQIGGK
jgi:type II secretory pathway pseudopilin PulG